jgi:hypothetical protein
MKTFGIYKAVFRICCSPIKFTVTITINLSLVSLFIAMRKFKTAYLHLMIPDVFVDGLELLIKNKTILLSVRKTITNSI